MHAVRSTSGHPVHRVAFSPCGGWFAAAQPHHGVTLHDRATGAAVRTFGNARRPDYASLAFLRDGAWVAAAGSKGLEVCAGATGERVHASTWFYGGPAAGVHGDVILSGGPLSVVEVLIPPQADGTDRREYLTVPEVSYYALAEAGPWAVGFREGANPVAIDLAVRRDGLSMTHPVRLDRIDAMTGRNIPAAVFAPAAPRVAILDGKTVTVFDLAAGPEPAAGGVPPPRLVDAPRFILPPPDEWKAGEPWRPPLAFTPDGRGLLVKRPRERVQLWNVDAGTLAAEWSWRLEGITCLAVAPDGLTAVAGGRFGRVLTWDLE
jgi:hypothetical protein